MVRNRCACVLFDIKHLNVTANEKGMKKKINDNGALVNSNEKERPKEKRRRKQKNNKKL